MLNKNWLTFGLFVVFSVSGCIFNRGQPKPDLTGVRAPTFYVDKLEYLDLRTVREVFPPQELVSVDHFHPRYQKSDAGLLGGIFASGDSGSVVVCVYKSEQTANDALQSRIKPPLDSYKEGGIVEGIPSKWWYKTGHTITILFTYGNSLSCIRLENIPPDKVKSKSAAAARSVAARLVALRDHAKIKSHFGGQP